MNTMIASVQPLLEERTRTGFTEAGPLKAFETSESKSFLRHRHRVFRLEAVARLKTVIRP